MVALFWLEIIVFTLLMQLQLILRVFRLKILCKGCDFGKRLPIKVRKHFPTFVLTFWLYGGLNQVMFLGLFLRCLVSGVVFL